MSAPEPGPIVVAVDGSSGSRRALAWGLALAERRCAPLRLVHAVQALDRVMDDLSLRSPLPDTDPGNHRTAADDLLADAMRRAATGHPGLAITTRLLEGSAAAALIEESRDADTLVMGTHGAEGFSNLVAGTTTMNVASHAHCTVVAVPTRPDDVLSGHGIVVGVDGSEVSHGAVRLAFREAAETGEELTAVYAWTGSRTASALGTALPRRYDPVRYAQAQVTALAEELALWAEKYPEVQVTRRTVQAQPVRALASASEGARLLVVGCHGRGALSSMPLGSVSHGVLHLATCPVAVVHDHDPPHGHSGTPPVT